MIVAISFVNLLLALIAKPQKATGLPFGLGRL